MTLTVIVQTRGRLAILRETLKRTLPAVSRPDTKVLLCVDDDDAETIAGLDTLPKDDRLLISVKPREDTRGPQYDRALTEAPADVYLPTTDKVPITRPGFDQVILDAAATFPDGIGCVCTPLINASFPGLQAPTAKLVDLMGYIYPPDYPFWFIDHHLDDICRMIGRYFTVDVGSDHFSLSPPKTLELRHLVFWTSYFDAMAPERTAQARAILDAMDEEPWRKAMLESNFGVVEYRSKWINDHVRSQAAQIESSRGEKAADERYLRVLKAATAHLLSVIGDGKLEEAA
jgi:hypothetical protein